MVDRRVMAIVPFSIGLHADIDKARGIVVDGVASLVQAEEVVGCPVVALGSSTVDMELRVWCADSEAAAKLKNDLLEMIKKRFDQGGIEFACSVSPGSAPN